MINSVVLVVTNHEDVTTDYIVLELERRGTPYYRLNTEWIPQAQIRYNPSEGEAGFELDFGSDLIQLATIGAAYFRRPGSPAVNGAIKAEVDRQYCESEWLSTLKALYSLVGTRWLNSPHLIEAAENKPLQLALAVQLGFRIPDTRITNDINSVRDLLKTGPLIAKPLRSALVGDEENPRVIFTNSIEKLDELNEQAISVAPIIFQRQIPKSVDVRVTVVGNNVFAAAIHSQVDDETRVDWRRGTNVSLEHTVLDLPSEIQDRCRTLVQRLGLRFGAIDLIRDINNEYWFLEINPNGQWAWIENRTGLPIAAAIVDELESIQKQ